MRIAIRFIARSRRIIKNITTYFHMVYNKAGTINLNIGVISIDGVVPLVYRCRVLYPVVVHIRSPSGLIAAWITGEPESPRLAIEEMTMVEQGRKRKIDGMRKKREQEQAAAARELSKAYVESIEKEIQKEEEKLQKAFDRLDSRKVSRPQQASSLERVGASFGNARAMLPVAERQIAIAKEQLRLQQESNVKLDDLRQALETARNSI